MAVEQPNIGSVSGVAVRGLADLQKAFRLAGKDASTFARAVLGDVAEPVQREAELLALAKISHIGSTVQRSKFPWWQMRIGITQRLVYVAPKQRGRLTRVNPALARPAFGTTLMEKAMEPALQMHEVQIERRVEEALERLADRWERI